MEVKDIHIQLLNTIPRWHYIIDKPMKKMFKKMINPEMYFCLLTLTQEGQKPIGYLANKLHLSKQHMTKFANILFIKGFVKRVNDEKDKRIVYLKITNEGKKFVKQYFDSETKYYNELISNMDEKEQKEFYKSLVSIEKILKKVESISKEEDHERD